MVFTAVTLLLILVGLVNFRYGLVFYLTYKLILVTNVTLISLPDIPLLTQEMFLTMWFLLLFLLRGKSVRCAHCELPFKMPFVLLVASWTLSAVFSAAGLESELSRLVGNVLEDVLLIWMIWEVFESHELFVVLYKSITFAFFVSCIYGFVELGLKVNPLIQYESTLLGGDARSITYVYTDTLSRGYRISSFFEHPIGAGVNWAIYSVFTFWLWINRETTDMRGLSGAFMAFALLTAFLCVPCIILTRMRSPLIFFLICCLALINFKSRRFIGFVLGAVVGILILLPVLSTNFQIFASLFSDSAQEQVRGSSFDMRLNQFQVAFSLADTSPIFGLGEKYAQVMPGSLYEGLYGSESIWLSTIVCHGYFGMAIELFYMTWSTFVVPRRFRSLPLFFFMLAYWTTATVTSLPGMKLYLLFLVAFFLLKTSCIYQPVCNKDSSGLTNRNNFDKNESSNLNKPI